MRAEVEQFIIHWGQVPQWINPNILESWLEQNNKEIWVEPLLQSKWESFNAQEKSYVIASLHEWLYG